MEINIEKIRNDFPILSREVNGKPLIYFDNGATTQKPIQVINRISHYYMNENSNVHRGTHYLSQLATEEFENARKYIAEYINASSSSEVIFTKGSTESINIVTSGLSNVLKPDDEIIITAMEHHSNMVPWQQLCIKTNAKLRYLNVDGNGEIDLNQLKKTINEKTKFLAIAHISNVLGTINPVRDIIEIAHNSNVKVLVDGAQAIAHIAVDVKSLDCDYYVFSAHKAYGPMGVGVLYGKAEELNNLSPYQYGGEMISNVSFEETSFNELPYKFEAGTPNVAGVLGMETALRYINDIGIENIKKHEDEVLNYATQRLKNINGAEIIGNAKSKTAVLSIVISDVHPFDLGTLLDQMGIAVRSGNHCAQPLMNHLSLNGTLRASFGIYNTKEEVDIFVDALERAITILQ